MHRPADLEDAEYLISECGKGDTPYGITKALRIDRHTAAKYAAEQLT